MKPKIGQNVYCVYRSVLGSCIIGTTVAFIGKDSFITNEFGKEVDLLSLEWKYDSYNQNWFTEIEPAKERLYALKMARADKGEKVSIREIDDNYWEAYYHAQQGMAK